MPIIPSSRTGISTDVPGYSNPVGQYGKSLDAISSLGQTVESLGLGLATKIKEDEAQTLVNNKKYTDKIKAANYLELQKQNSPDGYYYKDTIDPATGQVTGKEKVQNPETKGYVTLSEHYRDWANAQYQSALEDLPNNRSQELYQQEMGGFYSGKISEAFDTELVIKNRASETSLKDASRVIADGLESTPNVNAYYENYASMDSDIHKKVLAGVYPASLEDKLKQELRAEGVKSYFRGRINAIDVSAGKIDPQTGKRIDGPALAQAERELLAGKDPRGDIAKQNGFPKMSETLDPDTKASIDAQLIDLIKRKQRGTLSDFSIITGAADANSRMGNAAKATALYSQAQAMVPELMASGLLSPTHYQEFVAKSRAATAINKLNDSGFAFKTEGEQQKIVEGLTGRTNLPTGIGGEQASGVQKYGAELIKHITQAQQEDWGGATVMFAPKRTATGEPMGLVASALKTFDPINPDKMDAARLRAAYIESKNAYDKKGFPTEAFFNFFPKQTSKQMGDALQNPAALSDSRAVDSLKRLQAVYGPDYPKELNKLVQRGDLKEPWMMMLLMPNLMDNDKFVYALRTNDSLDKQYETLKSGAQFKADIAISRPTQLRDYIVAASRRNGISAVGDDQINKTIEVLDKMAAVGVVKGQYSNLRASYADVFKMLSDNGRFYKWGNTQMYIPAKIGSVPTTAEDIQAIDNHVRAYSNAESLKTLIQPINTDNPLLAKKTIEKMADYGHWTLNTNGDSLVFEYPADGTWIPAKGKDGKLLEVPIHGKFPDFNSIRSLPSAKIVKDKSVYTGKRVGEAPF